MKQEFSTSWNASTQPRKQGKFRYNAPLHLRTKFLSAHLSDALIEKHKRNSAVVRKGDEVLVMRGQFKKKTAKVTRVDTKDSKLYLEGLNITKRDGTKVEVAIDPSNVRLTTLVDDKFRFKVGLNSHPASTQQAQASQNKAQEKAEKKAETKAPAQKSQKKEAKK